MNKYGVVILAAGSSSRMGSPKQLLRYNNKSLISHIIHEAVLAVKNPVVVVTGANNDRVLEELNNDQITTVWNENWEQGMSSSIKAGVSEIMAIDPEIEGVILTVCDQPFIDSGLFKKLIDKKEQTHKGIVACTYDNTLGTPVLLDEKYFNELLSLEGQGGAKSILKKYDADVTNISFSLGNIDIDTPEDYTKLLNS